MINQELERYIESHTSNENYVLHSLSRETNLRTTLPRMLSGKVQGKFLEMISLMINPDKILEIGTFTGYSAICLARGLKPDGKLYTIESNEELEDRVIKYIGKSGYNDQIKLVIGDALKEIPGINEMFDLVFIDAKKEQYLDYYNLIKPKLKTGGFILTDNVLWDGKVIESKNPDSETSAIQIFNDYVVEDIEVEQVMLPIRDGLLLIRKIS